MLNATNTLCNMRDRNENSNRSLATGVKGNSYREIRAVLGETLRIDMVAVPPTEDAQHRFGRALDVILRAAERPEV